MVSTNVSPYAISGYNHVLRTRGTRKGGGLSLFVSEKLVHCEMADHCMAQSDTRMCSERHLYIHVYTNVYISKYSEYGCVCAHTWVFKCMYTCTRIWILHWCLSNTCYIYIYIYIYISLYSSDALDGNSSTMAAAYATKSPTIRDGYRCDRFKRIL